MRVLLLHPAPQKIARIVSAVGPFYPRRTAVSCKRWDYVVRWGVCAGNDRLYTMNTRQSVMNVQQQHTWPSILKLNNIPVCRHGTAYSVEHTIWRVHMVDFHIIAWQRFSRGTPQAALHSPRQLMAAVRIVARRALLAVGLHFGSVDICFSHGNNPIVHAIHAAPECSSRLFIRYIKALWNIIKQLHRDRTEPAIQREQRLRLGADPEFLLIRRDNKTLRYASDYFPPYGTVGFDRQSVNVQGTSKHVLAEIRPAPTHTPQQLVVNIRHALHKARRLAPDFNTKWLAGSYPHPGFPAGGHIHFSGIVPNMFLLRALDNYLAIPAMLMEHPILAAKRRASYGMLGDMRAKAHGGFEYRTLGSWLSGYRRAFITLSLAYFVIVEYPNLQRNILQTLPSQQAFYKGDANFFRRHFDRLWRDIEQTPSYKKWRQVLMAIRIWIHDRRYWQEEIDLKQLWNIR